MSGPKAPAAAESRRWSQLCTLVCAVALGSSLGCPSTPEPPPPLPAPTFTRRLSHAMGSAFAGAQVLPAPPKDARPLRVRVYTVALERLLGSELESWEGRLRMISRPGSEQLLAARSVALRGARGGVLKTSGLEWVGALEGRRGVACGVQRGLLFPGGLLEVAFERDRFKNRDVQREFLALRIGLSEPDPARTREGPTLDFAVEVQRAEEGRNGLTISREVVVGSPAQAAVPLRYGLILPFSPDPAFGATAFAIEVDPTPEPGSARAALLLQSEEDVRSELLRGSVRPAQVAPVSTAGRSLANPSAWAERARVLPPVREVWLEGSLAFRARLCEELLLSVDDSLLARVGELCAPAFEGPLSGWTLERSVALALVTLSRPPPTKEGDDGSFAPKTLQGRLVDTLLVERAGGLQLDLDLLEGTIVRARDLDSWNAILIEENRSLLGDPNAALRVLAHAWLTKRDAAVPGYEPLASREERRAALRASDP